MSTGLVQKTIWCIVPWSQHQRCAPNANTHTVRILSHNVNITIFGNYCLPNWEQWCAIFRHEVVQDQKEVQVSSAVVSHLFLRHGFWYRSLFAFPVKERVYLNKITQQLSLQLKGLKLETHSSDYSTSWHLPLTEICSGTEEWKQSKTQNWLDKWEGKKRRGSWFATFTKDTTEGEGHCCFRCPPGKLFS